MGMGSDMIENIAIGFAVWFLASVPLGIVVGRYLKHMTDLESENCFR